MNDEVVFLMFLAPIIEVTAQLKTKDINAKDSKPEPDPKKENPPKSPKAIDMNVKNP